MSHSFLHVCTFFTKYVNIERTFRKKIGDRSSSQIPAPIIPSSSFPCKQMCLRLVCIWSTSVQYILYILFFLNPCKIFLPLTSDSSKWSLGSFTKILKATPYFHYLRASLPNLHIFYVSHFRTFSGTVCSQHSIC